MPSTVSFKPHQRGGGCCSIKAVDLHHETWTFQTPSAGRWVLQLALVSCGSMWLAIRRFKPHQRGGGCCSCHGKAVCNGNGSVSNPISGEVGAAAGLLQARLSDIVEFQTPSAGRWVLQPLLATAHDNAEATVSNPISGEVGAAAIEIASQDKFGVTRFKPHQRGGGCCSWSAAGQTERHRGVSNPISGEVGAAAFVVVVLTVAMFIPFQTPSAGRWVLQPGASSGTTRSPASFKPHQRGGGCCSRWHCCTLSKGIRQSFKPHQRGGGCCSTSVVISCSRSTASFKPHQRGGGCCSPAPFPSLPTLPTSFKPHQRGGGCCSFVLFFVIVKGEMFQTPSAGRWVLQRSKRLLSTPSLTVSNPISGEVGAAAGSHPFDQSGDAR